MLHRYEMDPFGQAGQAPPAPGNRVLKAIRWLPLVVLGSALFAVGPVAIYYSFEMREKTEILTSRGEEATAQVINSYRAGRRGVDIHADVIFTTVDGEVTTEHLLGCDSDLLTQEYVRVVYDPQDPSFLRPSDCAGSHRLAWIVLTFGIAFSWLDLYLIRERWRAR